MKFEDVRSLLSNRFGETSGYETNRVLQQAFPNVKKERSTFIVGLRLKSAHQPTMSQPTETMAICQSLPTETEVLPLQEENEQLKLRLQELEEQVRDLRGSALSVSGLIQEADALTHSCKSDGLATIELFSMKSFWSEVKTVAPDLMRLFESVGDCSRNRGEDEQQLAVEQLKGLVALCTSLNSRLVLCTHLHV